MIYINVNLTFSPNIKYELLKLILYRNQKGCFPEIFEAEKTDYEIK